MDRLNPALEDILDRAGDTSAVMHELLAPPHNWSWPGTSPNNYDNMIEAVDDQVAVLADADTGVTSAGGEWDAALDSLVADGSLGLRLARVRYKDQPIKLRLFDGMSLESNGRAAKYQFALDFESAWERAEPAWIFKPTITLASYVTRREAIKTKEKNDRVAEKNEQHERAYLHSLAEGLNAISVDWYEVATATFGDDTVAGQLVRTIPTTYDPNRVPSKLVFIEHLAPSVGRAHLKWRASRGEHFFLSAQAPGATAFEMIVDNVTFTQWTGEGLAAGLWKFKGHASNEHGEGAESAVVQVTVQAAAAA